MTFLPEDDLEFLSLKQVPFEEIAETQPGVGHRRGVIFRSLSFEGRLHVRGADGSWAPCASCDVLILIPTGYATTRLDSFYTVPQLALPGGGPPNCATTETTLFGRQWQFWSRHLADGEWRPGVDGLETYLQYIRRELKAA